MAIIAAAGSGERLGYGVPKALVSCAGRPLIAWSLDAFAASTSVDRVVVTAPAVMAGELRSIAESVDGIEVTVIEGGPSRSASVRNGFRALSAAQTGASAGLPAVVVVVHDAARPLVTGELIDKCVAAVPAGGGVVAAAPVAETIKRAGTDHLVIETLDRSTLWSIQTPQVFEVEPLSRALDVSDQELSIATDDAALLERIGAPVAVHEWAEPNLKVTTEADLKVAEALLLARTRIT